MIQFKNITKIGFLAIYCVGGLNRVETRPKSNSNAKISKVRSEKAESSSKTKKSKSKSKAKSKLISTTRESKSLMDGENEIHELENKIKMYQLKLLQKEIEHAKLKISTMRIDDGSEVGQLCDRLGYDGDSEE